MSVSGPSPLGALLVQRLGAVLDATAQREPNFHQAVDKAQPKTRNTPLLSGNLPNTASTSSAPTTLGHAAKTILALLAAYPDPHTSVAGRQALLGSSAPPAAAAGGAAQPQGHPQIASQLAASLKLAVQGSGMFYESHLASLTFGKLSPAQLMQEPQAQITRTAEQAVTQGNTNTVRADNATQPAFIPGLDPQAHGLVRQQLEVLANQSFGWQGQAWPGAEMGWEISRRESDGQDSTEATDHWATRLTLNLPGLGQVQARINLAGKQLVMHLVSPESAELLDTHAAALRSRYIAQGLQLSQLSITSQESAPDAPATSNGTP